MTWFPLPERSIVKRSMFETPLWRRYFPTCTLSAPDMTRATAMNWSRLRMIPFESSESTTDAKDWPRETRRTRSPPPVNVFGPNSTQTIDAPPARNPTVRTASARRRSLPGTLTWRSPGPHQGARGRPAPSRASAGLPAPVRAMPPPPGSSPPTETPPPGSGTAARRGDPAGSLP